MKVGSLVECIDNNWYEEGRSALNEIYPIKNIIYTVRAIIDGTHILLEEIVNSILDYTDGDGEPCFPINCFRELQPPMNIIWENLLKEQIVICKLDH